MNLLLDNLAIALIAVFIIDYSGFIDSLESFLTRAFNSKFSIRIPKPFSCSLCSTFWASLIYGLVCYPSNSILFVILMAVLASISTNLILPILELLIDSISILISKIKTLING